MVGQIVFSIYLLSEQQGREVTRYRALGAFVEGVLKLYVVIYFLWRRNSLDLNFKTETLITASSHIQTMVRSTKRKKTPQ